MRKLWTTDPDTIQQEMEIVTKDKAPFSLFQSGQPTRKLTALEISEKDGVKHIIFTKLTPFTVSEDICYLIYHRPGEMMRGFHGPSQRESQQLLAVPFPTEIFQVQRRKFPRIDTPGNSQASIALDYAQLPNVASVVDICLEGAKMIGKLSPRIRKNDVIGPITFTLYMRVATMAIDSFTVPNATVTRVRELDEIKREIGIHFKISGEARATLEHYIKLRTIEDSAQKK
ncbi:MAG: PilZ domain-containing protein [Desulfobulbaceae bacterium]|nr:PilZ domain-containing protein [Desulfobulbaceae bacterium]